MCFSVSVCVLVFGLLCLILVPLHMQSEMIGAREASAANGTLEGFGSRVLSEVTCQFIGTSEPPVTALPCAPVWLLT